MIDKINNMFAREQSQARRDSDGNVVKDAGGSVIREFTLCGQKLSDLIISPVIANEWLKKLPADGNYLASLTHAAKEKIPFTRINYVGNAFNDWNRAYKVWKRMSPYFFTGQKRYVQELVAAVEAQKVDLNAEVFKLLALDAQAGRTICLKKVTNDFFFQSVQFLGIIVDEGLPTEATGALFYCPVWIEVNNGSYALTSEATTTLAFAKTMLLYKTLQANKISYSTVKYFSSVQSFLKR